MSDEGNAAMNDAIRNRGFVQPAEEPPPPPKPPGRQSIDAGAGTGRESGPRPRPSMNGMLRDVMKDRFGH